MSFDVLMNTPVSEFTEAQRKQIVKDHAHLHSVYGKQATEARNETVGKHVKLVEKLLELGINHHLQDGLDKTLPQPMVEQSTEAPDSMKAAPDDDLSKLNEPSIRSRHYQLHRLFRMYGDSPDGWESFRGPEDWVNFHVRMANEMKARGMTHIEQDKLDSMSRPFLEHTKSVKQDASQLEPDSRYLVTCKWLEQAGVVSKYLDGETILELGPGNGRFMEAMCNSGYFVSGVDSDEVSAGLARDRGLLVDVGDAQETLDAMEDKSVDSIVSMHTLEYTKNPAEVLQACKRVASKSAVHLVTLGPRGGTDHKHMWETIQDLRDEVADTGYSVEPAPDNCALLVNKSQASFVRPEVAPTAEELTVSPVEEIKASVRSPLTWVRPLKPGNAYDTLEQAWKEWGQQKMQESGSVRVEWKADGCRVHLVKEGPDVRIQSNNEDEEYSSKFPAIAKALRSGPDVVLDGELLAYDDSGEVLPREEITALINSDGPVDQKMIVWVFDILYAGDKWVTAQPYEERRRLLTQNVVKSPHIKVMPSLEATSQEEFMSLAKKVEGFPGAEGVVFKALQAVHSNNGATLDWAKVKIVSELFARVESVNELKGVAGRAPMYTYAVSLKGPKGFVSAASTMATAVKASKGDVVELRVLDVYKKEDGSYSLLLPRVIEKRTDKTDPSTTQRADQLITEIGARGKVKAFLTRMKGALLGALEGSN